MTSFVYVYLDRVSQSDELRWSIRSVKKHFMGESEIVIAGDRPAWFKGRCLSIKRHTGSRYADTHRKLAKAAREGISEKFVWMMDDIYFLRDFKLEELEINRYGRRWSKNEKGVIVPAIRAKSGWQKVKQRTVKLLMSNGFDTVYDYATHMPHLMEIEKHKEIFEKYKLESGRHLHELIYGNVFPGPAKRPVGKTLCYINRPHKTPSGYRTKIGDCWIANNNNRAWTPVLRTYLSTLFPEISENEITDAGEVGRKRIVTSKSSPNFGMSKREVMIKKMMAGENINEELEPNRTASNFSCEYKGEFIRKINGSKCGKRGGVDVFACQLNGEARREKAARKIQSCNQCHIFQNWLELS